MPELVIGNRRIADDTDVFVIAEIGHNHGGSIETALEMCKAAKECGCDAVKLQKRTIEKCFTKTFQREPYNSEHAYGDTYGEHRAALELGMGDYKELRAYCEEIGILFFATAFDEEAVDFLEEVGVPAYKIASGDLVNTPLIRHCARKGKPLILSTLGAAIHNIARANTVLYDMPAAFLHCTPYRTHPDDVNLQMVVTLREMFPERVIGMSSHFNGPRAGADSYYVGARIVEQHFTLDRTAKGSDHAMSLEPSGMRELVNDLRLARRMVGQRWRDRGEADEKALSKMEKVLYPTRTLPAGHVIQEGDLAAKSPATPDGLRPYWLDPLMGTMLIAGCSTADALTDTDIGDEE